MEALFEAAFQTKSVPVLLMFIVIFMVGNFLWRVVEFLWGLKKKDDVAHESTLQAILKEQVKIHKSINNCFYAIKSVAGPTRWEKVSKEIRERNNLET